MSNISGDGGSFSSGNTCGAEAHGEQQQQQQQQQRKPKRLLLNSFSGSSLVPNSLSASDSNGSSSQQPPTAKKRRNQPGNPDPNAEVIALSPKTLMATNRFVCEICNKGFQRDQNLQLHRRGHNLPWKLKQRTSTEIRKRVYVCPEISCVHHNPARALGDLTGIKKHFSRKHGEKKWKCDKCSKKYAVQSDWKAHSKVCGTKEYKCDCGTIFSRRDSFITHRAFCDALAEENNKLVNQGLRPKIEGNVVPELIMPNAATNTTTTTSSIAAPEFSPLLATENLHSLRSHMSVPPKSLDMAGSMFSSDTLHLNTPTSLGGAAHMSATALLQKAAQMGATASTNMNSSPLINQRSFMASMNPSFFDGSYNYQFATQFMQKGNPCQPPSFDVKLGQEMTDTEIYEPSDQSHGLIMESMEEGADATGDSLRGLSRLMGDNKGHDDMMTLDFMGIGGARGRSFHRQQGQGLDYEAVGLSPLHQQISGGEVTCDKSAWNV
ncbi:hypothetical protein NMG60_11020768 [Bertholletia excelsa]